MTSVFKCRLSSETQSRFLQQPHKSLGKVLTNMESRRGAESRLGKAAKALIMGS